MINVKIDSRKITKGDIFVCIKGSNVDGHDYIEDAIKNGASKIISEKDLNIDIPFEVVNDTQKWLNQYMINNYSEKINKLNIIGITGTNGKTTTCFLTYQMLNKLKAKTAYIGTIGFYIPEEKEITLPNTTPNILDLYELLLTAFDKGCKNVVMEVSSHALHQKRVAGIKFKIGAFTNFSEDHLDYHQTMEEYLNSKLLLLKQLDGVMIVNSDDKASQKFIKTYPKTISYGKSGNLKINSYKDMYTKTVINFTYNNKDYEVKTNLKSDFNVYNYLLALLIINNLGSSIEEIISITKDIYPPKGRCEQIKVKNALAVVDYAHTPDAVEKIIRAFNKHKEGKIMTIIGCGGDRDPYKRPIMGKIATDESDYVIFTSDNPRTENPNLILEDILKGVIKDNYEVLVDRRIAIKRGLDLLNDNDILLILGKGHEDYQIIGREKKHFSDKEEVEKYIRNLDI